MEYRHICILLSMSDKAIPGLLALKQIIESTSTHTGQDFFKSLVKHLAEILEVHGVWITEFWPREYKLNALAFWLNGQHVSEYIYDVTNTPCEPVLGSNELCHIPEKVIELYPKDPDLEPLGAVSYMGISLRDADGTVIGHLALLDNKPMPEIPEVYAIFKIFASRAAAELRRELAVRRIEESESKLSRLINGNYDAIIELDHQFKITQVNDAAKRKFEAGGQLLTNRVLNEIVTPKSYTKLSELLAKHERISNNHGTVKLLEPVNFINSQGHTFPADVSICQYQSEQQLYYLINVRDISEQILDKHRIRQLNAEATMLKEQVDAQQFSYIIGQSQPIKNCLDLVNQVAPTDANVLIQGETGTGKELFARAIHEASARASGPMITLNCAALPYELIESELFGHVKGAFTGAITAREGRFALANSGTLFLDEIAEIPLSLQAKLLRVIQEGTYEQLGSSITNRVDVRLIAATHQDLGKLVAAGKFREDLYYRLNVFPLQLPPLRERGDDVILLAEAFFQKLIKSRGISVAPMSPEHHIALLGYSWPGNVRELQNIVERGIISSTNGKFQLEPLKPSSPAVSEHQEDTAVLSFKELEQIEKTNIIKALNLTNWKQSGKGSASELLEIPRTTLASKIKKLGIKRVAVG